MMISSKDISVVVQGASDAELTPRVIASVRKFLPDAEIILSTWTKTDIDCDKLVISRDPGKIDINLLGNTNRQILGRRNGLKRVSRKYALILRSDNEIINLNFVRDFDGRIVAHSAGPIRAKWLYHLCDWNFFGLTDDLRNLYDIPLFSPRKDRDYSHIKYQTPHNWLAWNYFSKFANIAYCKFRQATQAQLLEYKKLLLEKFNLIGFHDDFGIINLKEPYYSEMLEYRRSLRARIKQYKYNFMRPNRFSLAKLLSKFTRKAK
ncbi:MAG: WavE lipopolysaccharide synthesis family protein [Deltaproteobacteria bacterium]|jgi:hypothetical protein|nr:WavE lipopolysaccharide synthesis family protein [Deltaproteobacteria bacterium]